MTDEEREAYLEALKSTLIGRTIIGVELKDEGYKVLFDDASFFWVHRQIFSTSVFTRA